jgi:hypothetical protein
MALAIAAISCSSSSNGSSVTKAKAFAYTDPTSTTDWRLVRDSSSTDTHLVLNLVGPTGSSAKGAGVTLLADATKAKWSVIGTDGQAVQNVAFNLGSGTPLVRGMVSGDALLAGVFQKGGNPVTTSSPVIRVALDLNTQGNIASGTAIPISVAANSAKIVDASGATADINLAVGQLLAN